MIIKTHISYGYHDLLKIFFNANNLEVVIGEREDNNAASNQVDLMYEDDSDTSYNITFMSVKHLGLENMLCDYLIRCGILPSRISIGKMNIKRDMAELDKKWEEHRKAIGIAR